jgi:hypothetical protein
MKNNLARGPIVKRLRHRPFKAVTGVQIPLGSPQLNTKIMGDGPMIFVFKGFLIGSNPGNENLPLGKDVFYLKGRVTVQNLIVI